VFHSRKVHSEEGSMMASTEKGARRCGGPECLVSASRHYGERGIRWAQRLRGKILVSAAGPQPSGNQDLDRRAERKPDIDRNKSRLKSVSEKNRVSGG